MEELFPNIPEYIVKKKKKNEKEEKEQEKKEFLENTA